MLFSDAENAQAYHATSSYNKAFNDTLTSENWNDLFSDFVNTWLPVSLNGPVGIATPAPAAGLSVNGPINATRLFTTSNVGIGTTNPGSNLHIIGSLDATGTVNGTGLCIAGVCKTDWSVVGATSGWTINGTTVYKTDINGNVGIGTTNPANKLTIVGSPASTWETATLRVNGSATEGLWFGYNTTNDVGLIGAAEDNIAHRNLSLAPTGGNVGVGTTAPTHKLEVNGNISISGSSPQTLRMGAAATLTRDTTTGLTTLATNNSHIALMPVNGNVGVGTTAPSSKLHVNLGSTGALGFNSGLWIQNNFGDVATNRGAGITMQNHDVYVGGIYAIRPVSSWRGDLAFYTHNDSSGNTFGTTFTEKMRIQYDGNVGIGITNPRAKLQVLGTIQSDVTEGGSAFIARNSSGVNRFALNTILTGGWTMYDFGGSAWNAGISQVNGNVGIAKTNPTATLDVTGSINASGTVNGTGLCIAGDCKVSWPSIVSAGGGNLWNGTTTGAIWNANGVNNVGIGKTNPENLLDVAGATKAYNYFTNSNNAGFFASGNNDYGTGLISDASDNLYLRAGASSNGKFTLLTTGNVGIGTTTPIRNLEVNSGSSGVVAQFTSSNTSNNYSLVDLYNASTGKYFRLGLFDSGVAGIGEGSSIIPDISINSSGNVGIGTTTPSNKLHVYGTSGRLAVFGDVGVSTPTATPVNISFGSTYGNSTPGSVNNLKWDLFSSSSSGSRYGIGMSANLMEFQSGPSGGLGFFVNQGSEAMRIISNGNVGISKTNPGATLDVTGSINASGTVNGTGLCIAGDCKVSWPSIVSAGGGNLWNGTTTGAIWNANGANNVGIGTTAPGAKLEVKDGDVKINSGKPVVDLRESDQTLPAGLWRIQTQNNQMGFVRNTAVAGDFSSGFTPLYFDANNYAIFNAGNVGIGTTAPEAKLEVAGNIKTTGAIYNSYKQFIFDPGAVSTKYTQYLGTFSISNGVVEIIIEDSGNSHGASSFFRVTRHYDRTPIVQIQNNGLMGVNYQIYYRNLTPNNYELFFVDGRASNGNNVTYNVYTRQQGAIISESISAANDTGINLANIGVVVSESGNVGIGTTGPSEKLHVNGGNIQVTGATDSAYFKALDTSNGVQTWFGVSSAARGFIGTITNHALGFRTNNADRLLIDASGNVGIMKTNPGTTLDIVGGINASGTVNGTGLCIAGVCKTDWGGVGATSGWTVNGTTVYKTDVNGNVGIGAVGPESKLEIYEATPLGGTLGNYQILTTLRSPGGSGGNNVYNRTWSLRDAAGTTWTTWREHNGLGIDTSYATPLTDRVWWERDPYNQIQSWGSESSAWLTINNGNVGIGTTNPRAPLEIYKDGAANIGSFLLDQPTIPTGSTSKGPHFFFKSGGIDRGWFGFFDNSAHGNGTALNLRSAGDVRLGASIANAPDMIIKVGGNVGISKTNPAATLDVTGSINASGTVNGTGLCIGGDCKVSWPSIVSAGGGNLWNGTTTGAIWNANGTNNVGIGTTNPDYKLVVNGGNLRINDAGYLMLTNDAEDSHIYFQNTGTSAQRQLEIKYTGAGTPVMVINNAGNVGIGTTAPTERLQVAGTFEAQQYKLPKQFYGQYNDLSNRIVSTAAFQGWSDAFQSKPISDVEYWNGSSWVAWTDKDMTPLFSGNRSTSVPIPVDRSRFRLTVQAGSWFGGGLLNIYEEWTSAHTGYSFIVERSTDKVSWTTIDTGTVPNGTYQAYIANLPHVVDGYFRITLDFGTLSVPQTLVWIRALTSRLSYGVQQGLPLSTSYNKTITMQGGLVVQGTSNSSVAGNLGIAKTNPGTTLDVTGSINASGTVNGTGLCIAGDCKVSWPAIIAAGGGNLWSGTTTGAIWNANGTNNVGVGTTAPGARLEVKDGGTAGSVVASIRQDDDSTYGLVINNGSWSGTLTNGLRQYVNLAGTYAAIDHYEAGGAKLILNPSGGNVGIGTTAPVYKLDVNGPIRSNATVFVPSLTADTSGYGLRVGSSYATQLAMSSNMGADFEMMHNTLIERNAANSSVYKWVTSHASFGSRGIRFDYGGAGSGIVFFADSVTTTAGTAFTPTQRMIIQNDGNVGINKLYPGTTLDVTGSINASGTVNGTGLCIGGDCKVSWPSIVSAGGGNLWNGTTTGAIWNANGVNNVGIGTTAPLAALHVNGGLILKRTTVADTDYTAQATDYIIGYSSLSTNRTVTLPDALCTPGRFFVVLDESGSASNAVKIIINPEGATPIVGQASFSLSGPYNSVYVFCGSSAWYVL
ncbi:MAG: hypothetical protein WC456_00830 [Patescibacteria group bacterium]